MTKKKSFAVRLRTFAHRQITGLTRQYYNRVWGTSIGEGTRVSLSARIDKTNPKGVVVGKHSAFAFEASILTHDFVNGKHLTTKVGDYCFVGARTVLMPGVEIGDHCIIATGTVVMKSVPSNSIVFGNPGRVMERGILTGQYGRRVHDLSELTRPEEQEIRAAMARADALQLARSDEFDIRLDANVDDLLPVAKPQERIVRAEEHQDA